MKFPELFIIRKYVKIEYEDRESPCYFCFSQFNFFRSEDWKYYKYWTNEAVFCFHFLWRFSSKNWFRQKNIRLTFCQKIYDFNKVYLRKNRGRWKNVFFNAPESFNIEANQRCQRKAKLFMVDLLPSVQQVSKSDCSQPVV